MCLSNELVNKNIKNKLNQPVPIKTRVFSIKNLIRKMMK